MSLGVLSQQFTGGIEMGVFADAGENVGHLAAIGFCILHSVSGEERQAKMIREINKLVVDLVFTANEMSLNFHENIFATESIDEKLRAIVGSAGSGPAVCGGAAQIIWVRRPTGRRRRAGRDPRIWAGCGPRSQQ